MGLLRNPSIEKVRLCAIMDSSRYKICWSWATFKFDQPINFSHEGQAWRDENTSVEVSGLGPSSALITALSQVSLYWVPGFPKLLPILHLQATAVNLLIIYFFF